MPVGRPTKYSPDILQQSEEYIDSCEDREEQVVSGQSEKFTAFKTRTVVNLPTIEGLALHLKVHRDTIFEWESKYPDFSDTLNVLRGKQLRVLLNKGLSGDYNPMIAKLVLHKHGYTEKTEISHSVAKGQSFKIGDQTIEF